ncbi:MAG TPA: serine hydrolase [Terriglobia bacterium]|nr:serine hydrolase [Terriglobia bacterium]
MAGGRGSRSRVVGTILTSVLLGICKIAGAQATTAAQSAVLPSEADVKQILVHAVDTEKRTVGIVVGLIGPQGSSVVSYGRLDQKLRGTPGPDTVYEIGSITKVFTSLLLADMVKRSEVALDDPVAKYLPKSVKMPSRNGKQITLVDLATHTSGLPRLPSNLKPANPENPYADYTVEDLYAFLSSYQLTRDPGSKYEYSNLGGGLLGHLLALRAGKDYEALLRERVLAPLHMDSTGIHLTADERARLAAGHSESLAPAANWDLPTLAGAGALRSTAHDMLLFLSANLGFTHTPLAAAMEFERTAVRRPTGVPDLEVALGWHILEHNGNEIVWHNGGTGGYRSWMGLDLKKRIGVVVLSNSANSVDDIGQHLVDSSLPLVPYQAPKERTAISVDPKVLDAYVGRYQLTPRFIITVTRNQGSLYVQATGQPKFEIFAEAPTEFFLKVVNAQITFVTGPDGHATEMILHQGGANQHLKKIE